MDQRVEMDCKTYAKNKKPKLSNLVHFGQMSKILASLICI